MNTEERIKTIKANLAEEIKKLRKEKEAKIKELRKKPKTSSVYKGVSWHNLTCSWSAQIRIGKKIIQLGRFKTEIEAAEIAKKAFEIRDNDNGNIT